MKTEKINDYARPSMRLVNAIQAHHEAMLKRDKSTAFSELEKAEKHLADLWKATIDSKT